MATQIDTTQRGVVPGPGRPHPPVTSTLGVGIIGVSPVRGWAATAHIPALRALPNYEIRALSAHSAESARAAGQAFGVSAVFSEHEQLVTQPDIDVVAVSVLGDVVGQPNAYMLDKTNGANLLTIAVGHSLDILNYVLGEFADLSAVSDLRRPLITIEETAEQVVKTAADQIAVIGTLTSGATASVHIREAVAGGTGFLSEINGTDGTLRITADAAYPEIYPLTVSGAHGRNEPAELAFPAALTQKWPALTSLEGAPAYNVGRAYAALAADIDSGTHTVPDFADAVRRHEPIPAIERSAASGERVKA